MNPDTAVLVSCALALGHEAPKSGGTIFHISPQVPKVLPCFLLYQEYGQIFRSRMFE